MGLQGRHTQIDTPAFVTGAARPGFTLRSRTLPLAVTLLWLIGTPTVFVFGNAALAGVPVLTVDRAVYLVVAILLFVQLVQHPASLPLSSVEVAGVVYLSVVLVSWCTTIAQKDVIALKRDADFLLTCFAMPCTAYVVARTAPWTAPQRRRCVWLLVGGLGTYLAVVGIVQATYDWNFLVVEAVRNVHPERAKGSFENSLPYGVVLSMLLMLAFVVYLHARTRTGRGAALGIAAGLVEAIGFSQGRAVWLGAATALLFLALRCPRLRLPAAVVTLALLGQVVLATRGIGINAHATGPRGDSMRARVEEVDSIYNRIAGTATAVNMIVHRPVFGFGVGLETFMKQKGDYYASWGDVSPKWAVELGHPHNDFLNILVLTGVIGLVAYVAFLWSIWRLLSSARRRWQWTDPFAADLALLVQASFIVILIVGQFHDVMYMSYVQLLFYFLLGVVAGEGAASPREACAA